MVLVSVLPDISIDLGCLFWIKSANILYEVAVICFHASGVVFWILSVKDQAMVH